MQKSDKLYHVLSLAVDTLPSRHDTAWDTLLDDIKCRVENVQRLLRVQLDEVEMSPSSYMIDLDALIGEKMNELFQLHPVKQPGMWQLTCIQIQAIADVMLIVKEREGR